MSVDSIGQLITFASQVDPDQNYSNYVYVRAQKGDTIQKIAARRGQPGQVNTILSLNRNVKTANGHYLRSSTQVLKTNQQIKLPGTLAQQDSFDVHCGDEPPLIRDGYATYDTVNRPGRVGLNRFLGYNPIEMDIAIQFEGYAHAPGDSGPGQKIEGNIQKLERMAGRGAYPGAATGPPSVLGISVTDNNGNVVPLIPFNYQWSPKNQTAPLYRISAIQWGTGALRDDWGRRIRQLAVVTVRQYTPVVLVRSSTSQRAKSKQKHKKK